jgi:hypothetical protein
LGEDEQEQTLKMFGKRAQLREFHDVVRDIKAKNSGVASDHVQYLVDHALSEVRARYARLPKGLNNRRKGPHREY